MPYRFDTDVTNPQKTAVTQDFAAATGWANASGLTRAQWLDRQADNYVRNVVKAYRLRATVEAAHVAAGADMVNLEE